MHKGSCLCGKIRYEYHGEITELAMCHCSLCRKAQGVAFATNAPVDARKFFITHGAEFLKEYRSSLNKARVFCSHCGSPIYSALDETPDVKRLRLGTLETLERVPVAYHIHYAAKAAWFEATDSHPRFAAGKK
jgi:hypothetical protein